MLKGVIPMAGSTKEKILSTALTLFAKNGYAGTSVADIAGALGLSKSALYKHFGGKEEIWNAILQRGEEYYDEHIGVAHQVAVPKSREAFVALSMGQVDFTVHDSFIKQCRHIMAVGQFSDPRVCALATRHYITRVEEFYAPLFEEMMKNGILRQGDPSMLALSYTSPISVLIQQCDREPRRTDEIMNRIRRFAEFFADEWFLN